jgi:hypothetical protein
MPRLRSLSLHLLPTIDHIGVSLPSRTCVVLPALTHLNFQGITEYLEALVGGIDAPHLGTIEISVSNESVPDLSNFRIFIDRIVEIHSSHNRVHILFSERGFSFSLTQPGASTFLTFQVSCKQLNNQISTISRVFIHFSSLLSGVEDLRISATRPSRGEESVDSGLWREPLNLFTGVKWFHVPANLSTDIGRALQQPGKPLKAVLPALQKVYITQPGLHRAPLMETVVSFMVSRWHSGHPVAVEYERLCQFGGLHGIGRIYSQCGHQYSLTLLE